MEISQILLILATLLCGLTAGLVFAFAVVIMPGIRDLDDAGFIRAFQVMDGVIQRNQPLFTLVWAGSALALIAAAVMGYGQLAGTERTMLLAATAIYVLGVQIPTVTINVPLNNRLQALDVDTANAESARAAREAFESRWNRWNSIRTVLATVTTAMLLVVLFRV